MKRTTFLLATAMVVAFFGAGAASAELIYALTTQNSVAVFDSSDPGRLIDGGAVTNLAPGAMLQSIDFRPADGRIYLLDDHSNLYRFNPFTFGSSLVGNFGPPGIPGTAYGFDFNPSFAAGEFARIITDTDDNRVISGNTGQYLLPVEKTDVAYGASDINFGEPANIVGIAYTNSVPNSPGTQQYGVDSRLAVLTTVANNAGTLGTVGSLGVSPLTKEVGFDVSGPTGVAYAALQPGLNSHLYTVDLTTGLASDLGSIGAGDVIRSLAVVPQGVTPFVPEPASLGLLAMAALGLMRRRK